MSYYPLEPIGGFCFLFYCNICVFFVAFLICLCCFYFIMFCYNFTILYVKCLYCWIITVVPAVCACMYILVLCLQDISVLIVGIIVFINRFPSDTSLFLLKLHVCFIVFLLHCFRSTESVVAAILLI